MKTKQKAFTLVELLAVVAISSILLFIATDRLIGDSFRANATYNQRVDVQTGVKTSMDNIKSILRRSVQVHLVGKEVYMEDMDLTKLDNKYNYIAFRKDSNGNRFLANIVYDKTANKFNVLPLTAGDKKDIMTGDNISYNLEFYKNDNNYKKKLENDMLNITVTGKSSANVMGKGINDTFELKEDIQLPNVNQILLSRHLQGGIDKITALAYDNGVIQPGKKAANVGIVLVIDSSGSMNYNMRDLREPQHKTFAFRTGPNRYQLGHTRRSLRPEIYTENDLGNPRSVAASRKVVLGSALNNVLLPMFHNMASSKNLNFQAYIFDYGNDIRDYRTGGYSFEIDRPRDYSAKYFTTLELARQRGYGPFKLETSQGYDDAKATVSDKAGMKLDLSLHNGVNPAGGPATNTGFAMLTGLELVKQLKEQGVEKRYMIVLTDGEPNLTAAFGNDKRINAISRDYYNRHGGYGLQYGGKIVGGDVRLDIPIAMEYIRNVTGTTNNPKGLYEKSFLIGITGIDSEVSRLGVPPDIKKQDANIPSGSINAYLRQTGNKTEAYLANDSHKLEEAFKRIANDIGVSLGVFDGPDKMR